MRRVSLFIDETGKHDYSHPSPYFILSGCAIPTEHIDEIRNLANNILFKYWGSQRSYSRIHGVNRVIVFHAYDIFRCNGVFRILRDRTKMKNFWDDLYGQLLSRRDIVYFIILVNKAAVRSLTPSWTPDRILQRAYAELLGAFINYLIQSNSVGEVVAESAANQDIALVNSLSYFQRNSWYLYADQRLVNDKITSLSFVNKNDNNIGAQIADLIARVGSNKYDIDQGIRIISSLRNEEKKLLRMFEHRLLSRIAPWKFNKFAIIDH